MASDSRTSEDSIKGILSLLFTEEAGGMANNK